MNSKYKNVGTQNIILHNRNVSAHFIFMVFETENVVASRSGATAANKNTSPTNHPSENACRCRCYSKQKKLHRKKDCVFDYFQNDHIRYVHLVSCLSLSSWPSLFSCPYLLSSLSHFLSLSFFPSFFLSLSLSLSLCLSLVKSPFPLSMTTTMITHSVVMCDVCVMCLCVVDVVLLCDLCVRSKRSRVKSHNAPVCARTTSTCTHRGILNLHTGDHTNTTHRTQTHSPHHSPHATCSHSQHTTHTWTPTHQNIVSHSSSGLSVKREHTLSATVRGLDTFVGWRIARIMLNETLGIPGQTAFHMESSGPELALEMKRCWMKCDVFVRVGMCWYVSLGCWYVMQCVVVVVIFVLLATCGVQRKDVTSVPG